MSSSNLRIGGLVSGLDTDQIIKDLVKAQRLKLSGYQQNKTILEWKQQDYRSINNLLRRLRDVTSDLRLQGTYLRKVAVSSQESVVTATGGTTGEGVYSIVVTRLATSATKVGRSLSADPTAKIDTSASLWSQRDLFADGTDADTDTSVNFEWGSEGDTFSFSINGEEFTFANTVTLDRIFAEVSANENAKVTMMYDSFTDRVVITTKSTG
ncbi:MAG: flagellar cap protein FliD N-terminal domain-containing protein, partial [Bacillota bacterium]